MRITQLIIQSLKLEASEAELRELDAWRRASAANERHYRDFVELWEVTQGGDDIAIGTAPDIADILGSDVSGKDLTAGPELVRFPRGRAASAARGPARRKRWRPIAAIAAAVAAVSLGTWTVITMLPRSQAAPLALGADELVTGTSEMATVSLRDGSVVRLAPNSRLLLSGTTEEREVGLKGRAYFAISPDEKRPFRIRADAGSITVLGTRFDLESDGDDLRLIVVEGSVRLSAGGRHNDVAAGQMSRVLAGTLVPPVNIPNIFTELDWVGDFLAFQATPLAQAVHEIEREYDVRVEITDPALARRTVTGWFADKTPDEVLRVVCAVVVAQCTTDGGTVTIDPPPDGIIDTTLPPRF